MKTFVFDADGVVCIGANFSFALEAEHGIPRENLVPFFRDTFPDCILGRRDLKATLTPYLPIWGWKKSADEFLNFWFQREHVLCPQVLACVQALKARGHRCVLGTNQESHRAAYLTREMKLGESFDRIFASCEMGAAKPSVDFFHGIETHLASPPTDLCLIDDAAKNVAGAQSADWSAIHYRSPADIPKIMAMAR